MTDGNGSQGGRPIEFCIGISEYFLRHRNFNGCRKYALRAREYDLNDARVEQIIAVADVIEASKTRVNDNKPDWYAILRVNRYSQDLQLIRTQFKNLLVLLNPNKNKFPLAIDAFMLVCEAWNVLGNPSNHSQFDNELRILASQSAFKPQGDEDSEGILNHARREDKTVNKCGSDNDTFWTMCPYCYYVYEYERVYEDCCLRCQNCRRGFHAVGIPSSPPSEVVRKGEYWCFGFCPLGFEGGEEKRVSSWTPFAPMRTAIPEVEVKKANGVSNSDNLNDLDEPTEISDNGADLSYKLVGKHGVASIDGDGSKELREEVKSGVQSHAEINQTEVTNEVKPASKRRKSVVRNTKKLMGKGIRIIKQENISPAQSNGGGDFNLEDSENY